MRERSTGRRGEQESAPSAASGCGWLSLLRQYLLAIAAGNLIWEFAELPLYTIWQTGTPGKIVFAAVHCTGGDILIAGAALMGTLVVAGGENWPLSRYRTVAVIAVAAGFTYTVFSEWVNVEVRGSWSYSEWMPRIPPLGSGMAPPAQWAIIPSFAFWWARRRISA
jgi:hypothetical protein